MAERERRPRREQPADPKARPSRSRPERAASRGASIARRKELDRAVRLIDRICRVAGNPNLVQEARRRLARRGVPAAIRRHDSAVLFEWLAEAVSFQGIANSVAYGYMQRHGRVRWDQIAHALDATPSCQKLESYWHFEACGYRKAAHSCAEPLLLPACPLPTHDLRNGGLNQAVYSLFLFIRDIAAGDLVGWLDERLASVDRAMPSDRNVQLRAALLHPICQIRSVSNKVASMALSQLLLAGDRRRPLWIEAGTVLIAVDTLVHNFLHRTGMLARLGTLHPYGSRCYGAGGCAEIVDRIAGQLDARHFNPAFPTNFPRFVQHAIWRFCAEDGLDECNGHQIDDRVRCDRRDCPAYRQCDRVPLKPERKRSL
jgi:hypothetical protein